MVGRFNGKISLPVRLLTLLCFGHLLSTGGCDRGDTIVVGAKAFTEGYLLGHMAVELLESEGYDVEEQFGVASAAMRKALESGQIDLYYEYTGTAYTVYAGGKDVGVMSDSARVLQAVRHYDSSGHDLRWLAPLPFNNTYTLLMKPERAAGISTLGQLAAALDSGRSLSIAVDGEFNERPDGMKALAARYGMPTSTVRTLDAGLAWQALSEGEVDVSMGYSTDGRIETLGLVELRDDLHFFPAYNPAAVVRGELLARDPRIAEILGRLNAHLTTTTIRRLNAAVDIEHRDPRKVAHEWLVETGLLRSYSAAR
jgi:osmoprotectant transport system substrate-binding protein